MHGYGQPKLERIMQRLGKEDASAIGVVNKGDPAINGDYPRETTISDTGSSLRVPPKIGR